MNKEKSLYFNAWEIVKNTDYFLYLFIGGRGIGKSYSIQKGLIMDNDRKFIYLRTSENEMEMSLTRESNTFKAINRDCGTNIEITKEKKVYLIEEVELKDDERLVKKSYGIAGALSTFAKYRGTDFDDYDFIFYDEFISKSPIKTAIDKKQATLFFDMIETVNRNREVSGRKPVKIILCGNANMLDNAILRELELPSKIMAMIQCNQEKFIDEERGLYLHLPIDVPISREKKNTALYRLLGKEADYTKMATSNIFVNDDFSDIKKIQRNKLLPLFSFENLYFYQVKDSGIIYVSKMKSQCPCFDDEKLFKREKAWELNLYIDNKMIAYQDYDLKLKLKNIIR